MYQRVIVVLDGSPFAEAILDPVARLAEGTRTTVVLLGLAHSAKELAPVVEGGTPPSLPFGFAVLPGGVLQGVEAHMIESQDQAYERLRHLMSEYLEGHAAHMSSLGIRVETDIATGDPVDAVVDYCRRSGADLIATAAHARTGVAHLLHPGVAEKLLYSGIAPVLLVRSDAPMEG